VAGTNKYTEALFRAECFFAQSVALLPKDGGSMLETVLKKLAKVRRVRSKLILKHWFELVEKCEPNREIPERILQLMTLEDTTELCLKTLKDNEDKLELLYKEADLTHLIENLQGELRRKLIKLLYTGQKQYPVQTYTLLSACLEEDLHEEIVLYTDYTLLEMLIEKEKSQAYNKNTGKFEPKEKKGPGPLGNLHAQLLEAEPKGVVQIIEKLKNDRTWTLHELLRTSRKIELGQDSTNLANTNCSSKGYENTEKKHTNILKNSILENDVLENDVLENPDLGKER